MARTGFPPYQKGHARSILRRPLASSSFGYPRSGACVVVGSRHFCGAVILVVSVRSIGTRGHVICAIADFRRWQAGPGADVTTLVGDAWTMGFEFYCFGFVYLVALHCYYTLRAQEKNILRESALNVRLSGSTLLYAFGIPPNIRNSA